MLAQFVYGNQSFVFDDAEREPEDYMNYHMIANDSKTRVLRLPLSGSFAYTSGDFIAKANPEAVNAFGHEAKQAGAASPEREGNWAKSTFEDLVQYNDGFKTNLIGTPQQIAERIVELKAVGVDLILSGFLHFQEEVAYFGEKVLPIVRELEAQKVAVAA